MQNSCRDRRVAVVVNDTLDVIRDLFRVEVKAPLAGYSADDRHLDFLRCNLVPSLLPALGRRAAPVAANNTRVTIGTWWQCLDHLACRPQIAAVLAGCPARHEPLPVRPGRRRLVENPDSGV